jgi:hypothetical protein
MALYESGSTSTVLVRMSDSYRLVIHINSNAFGLTGKHWQEQLAPPNRAKWGNIYYMIDPAASRAQRREACADLKGVYAKTGLDIDECPGAMFFWDGEEDVAHVMPVDFASNRSLGAAIGTHVRNVVGAFGGLKKNEGYPVQFRFI